MRTMRDWRAEARPLMIAGVVGPTAQAVAEAELAVSLGYDAALLSLAALKDADNRAVLEHCRRVADVIPVVGFYLQPAVGGRVLDRSFWRGFFDIERVVAIKIAPFDRYRTIDVTDALAESGRTDVALYTGNDDAIVADLLTPFPPNHNGAPLHFSGGLLGQWAVWTRTAVDLLQRCHAVTGYGGVTGGIAEDALQLLELGAELTDANAALFDPGAPVRRLHSGNPRGLAPAGAARRPLVSRSARRAEPWADGRDRSRACPLPALDRRRVRKGAPAQMAGMTRTAALAACLAIAVTIARMVALGQAGPPADLVLLNARVLTVDAKFSVAEALAVRDGRFAAVGANEAIRRLVGPSTTVIEGRGRTVVPGIIDTHVHSLEVATAEATQPFRNLRSVADIQAWLKEETARRPAGTWLWTPRTYPTRLREHRFPTRQELDAVAPDHPVVVDSAYAFSLNTAALRASGITRDTPNPQGGAIVKNAAGEPTGLLRNAGSLLSKFRRGAQGLTLDALENVHRHYLAAGITSVIERGAGLEGFETYRALKAANRLVVRSTVTIRVPQAGDAGAVQQFIDKLPFKPGEGDAWLKAGPLKLVADGGILIGTAYMRQPYGEGARELYALDDPKDRGFLSLTPEQLAAAIAAIHARGWQLVVHVTGDAGVDVVLDGVEAAQKQAPGSNRRHTLIHAYFVNAETAARVAKLGMLVDTQPAWHYKDADALATGLGAAAWRRSSACGRGARPAWTSPSIPITCSASIRTMR